MLQLPKDLCLRDLRILFECSSLLEYYSILQHAAQKSHQGNPE
jgi:hypothetical protein